MTLAPSLTRVRVAVAPGRAHARAPAAMLPPAPCDRHTPLPTGTPTLTPHPSPLAVKRNGGASCLKNVKNDYDLLSRAYNGASLATYNGRTLTVRRGRRRGEVNGEGGDGALRREARVGVCQ